MRARKLIWVQSLQHLVQLLAAVAMLRLSSRVRRLITHHGREAYHDFIDLQVWMQLQAHAMRLHDCRHQAS